MEVLLPSDYAKSRVLSLCRIESADWTFDSQVQRLMFVYLVQLLETLTAFVRLSLDTLYSIRLLLLRRRVPMTVCETLKYLSRRYRI